MTGRDGPYLPRPASLAIVAGVVAAAFLLHGPVGAVLVVVGLAVTPPAAGARAGAGAAVCLLAVAALATVLEAPLRGSPPDEGLFAPPRLSLDYALERPMAAEAGRLAALALLAAVGTSALAAAPRPAPDPGRPRPPRRRTPPAAPEPLPPTPPRRRRRRRLLPGVAGMATAVVLRVLGGRHRPRR